MKSSQLQTMMMSAMRKSSTLLKAAVGTIVTVHIMCSVADLYITGRENREKEREKKLVASAIKFIDSSDMLERVDVSQTDLACLITRQPQMRFRSRSKDVEVSFQFCGSLTDTGGTSMSYGLCIEKFDGRGFMTERKSLWPDGTTRLFETIDSTVRFDNNGDEIVPTETFHHPCGSINF